MEEDVLETPAPVPAPIVSVRSFRSRRSPVVVTSRTVVREHHTVPYEVYVGISRECDFLRGQNYELRRLVVLPRSDTVVEGGVEYNCAVLSN